MLDLGPGGRGAPHDLTFCREGPFPIFGPRWAVAGLSRAAGPDCEPPI